MCNCAPCYLLSGIVQGGGSLEVSVGGGDAVTMLGIEGTLTAVPLANRGITCTVTLIGHQVPHNFCETTDTGLLQTTGTARSTSGAHRGTRALMQSSGSDSGMTRYSMDADQPDGGLILEHTFSDNTFVQVSIRFVIPTLSHHRCTDFCVTGWSFVSSWMHAWPPAALN